MQYNVSRKPMSRGEIHASLTDDLIEQLRALIGAQREVDLFRDRLVHILTRYEIYAVHAHATRKNDRRNQLTKLRDKAAAFMAALDTLNKDVKGGVQGSLETITPDKWENWTLNEPLPKDDPSLEQGALAAARIKQASSRELEILDASKGEKKTSKHLGLDQLLIDLASLYEAETDKTARSQCYYSDFDENYTGPFFEMALTVLNAHAAGAYSSSSALGKRIGRVLADD